MLNDEDADGEPANFINLEGTGSALPDLDKRSALPA